MYINCQKTYKKKPDWEELQVNEDELKEESFNYRENDNALNNFNEALQHSSVIAEWEKLKPNSKIKVVTMILPESYLDTV